MYRVLYRKWRPQTFEDVSGQPHITDTLMNEVKENRLAHAYLFTGSRGTGKTSCAKILSKAINCLNPVNGNPCNKCEICKGIDEGSVLDVVEIDAASNRGIDDIRALREESAFTPAQAKFRVYIIDEVHMLTIEAFNALLKTLEEPPEHIVFILATTEVQKLPSTILSRCQRFDFRRISVDSIVDRLKYVASQENVSIDNTAATLIARIADGGMRDALSIFDRCLSISENVDEKVVSDAAGIMSKDYLFALSYAFKNKDTSKALSIIDELHNSSCDTERLCTELTNHFRSLLVIKSVNNPENILVSTNEELEELKNISELFSIEEILSIMNILSATIASIKVTQNRRVETEMAIIKICSPEVSTDITALYARIAKLEQKLSAIENGNIAVNTSAVINTQKSVKKEDPIAEQKNPSTEDILSGLVFDDDSAEYDDFDEIPLPETAPYDGEPVYDMPYFDEVPPESSQPHFDEEPSVSSIPLFDEAPAEFIADEPMFDELLSVEESAPVFDEAPSKPKSNTVANTSKLWMNCIIEAENKCPPLIGHLIGTNIEINGNNLIIYGYKNVLPMIFPMVKDVLTTVVRNLSGQQDMTVRLG